MRSFRWSQENGLFQEGLAALLGKDAPNLSPAVISRLTAEWQGDYDAWQKRDLSARRGHRNAGPPRRLIDLVTQSPA
jgi:hypothetical protein